MFDRGFLAVGHEAARIVRRIDPEVEVAILGPAKQRALPEEMRRSAEFGCRFFQPFREFLAPDTFATAEKMGLYGNVFFSDTDVENRRLIAAGASGILTNRVDLLRETCEALDRERKGAGGRLDKSGNGAKIRNILPKWKDILDLQEFLSVFHGVAGRLPHGLEKKEGKLVKTSHR